jgi:hypothetical protein
VEPNDVSERRERLLRQIEMDGDEYPESVVEGTGNQWLLGRVQGMLLAARLLGAIDRATEQDLASLYLGVAELSVSDVVDDEDDRPIQD